MTPSLLVAALIIAAVALTAALGAALTSETVHSFWYTWWLRHPRWQPPASWFGIVWTALYVCMAAAQLLVESSCCLSRQDLGMLRGLFALSLVLNYSWNVAFAQHRLWRAALVCQLLTAVVYAEMWYIAAFGASVWAWWLLLPYLAWSAFATLLSVETARMN